MSVLLIITTDKHSTVIELSTLVMFSVQKAVPQLYGLKATNAGVRSHRLG